MLSAFEPGIPASRERLVRSIISMPVSNTLLQVSLRVVDLVALISLYSSTNCLRLVLGCSFKCSSLISFRSMPLYLLSRSQPQRCPLPYLMFLEVLLDCLRKLFPEGIAEYPNHDVQPEGIQPLCDTRTRCWLSLKLPLIAYLIEPLGIVCDHAVKFLLDAPFHEVAVIHRPGKEWAVMLLDVPYEARSNGPKENLLQHVEGDVGNGKELPGVACGESYM